MEKDETNFGKRVADILRQKKNAEEELDIHIGQKIAQLLEEQHMTKQDLADELGMTHGNVAYLCKRSNIGVSTVHNIGKCLKYNFWKHFPIDDGNASNAEVDVRWNQLIEEKNKLLAEQEMKIASLQRDVEVVKQENGYLKEINGLLRKKKE